MPDMNLIADAAYQAGFRGDDLITAVAVAMAESGGRPDINNAGTNSNGTVDYGLWQINSIHGPDLGKVYDPYYNARLAYGIWQDRDSTWAPWSAYNNGSYTKFIGQAKQAVKAYQPSQTDPADMVQGEWDTPQGQQQTLTPRLRAESMLAQVARAVKRNGEVSTVSLTPTDEEPEAPTVDTNGGGDNEYLAELNGFLQAREIIAEPGELPAEELIEDQTGLPSLTQEEIGKWLATGLQSNAARGAAVARALGFVGTIGGVGQRSNPSDHPHGNAIDLMTMKDRATGQMLADFFVRFASELGVKYVIWEQRIASAKNGWEWRGMEDRGSATANHMDHPHISFYGGNDAH